MKQIVNGKLYNTDTAEVVASDRYWDGHNLERSGRNTHLYKTKKGAFFVVHETSWQSERNYIEPVSMVKAKDYYEVLPEHVLEYGEVFGEEPEEA